MKNNPKAVDVYQAIRTQARTMIPAEVAESARELARYLSTGDPGALESAVKHGQAATKLSAAANHPVLRAGETYDVVWPGRLRAALACLFSRDVTAILERRKG